MRIALKSAVFIATIVPLIAYGWGHNVHKTINRQAVHLLPHNSLYVFFNNNIEYLSENAVNADKRTYVQEDEGYRHYINLDSYANMGQRQLPKYYSEAKNKIPEDSLKKNGILPWCILYVQKQLTKAMLDKNADLILRLAADLGHYAADANVPLHTTRNFDGQLTNQKGIHALWETKIPKLYASNYNFHIGKAEFINDVQAFSWEAVNASYAAVDSVLTMDAILIKEYNVDQSHTSDNHSVTNRVNLKHYCERYSKMLDGQVERQMRKSIKMAADLWYTSWVEAGQPDLSTLKSKPTR